MGLLFTPATGHGDLEIGDAKLVPCVRLLQRLHSGRVHRLTDAMHGRACCKDYATVGLAIRHINWS